MSFLKKAAVVNTKKELKFDHTQESILKSVIPNADRIGKIMSDIVVDHDDMFGDKPSEVAEWIYKNADDPTNLLIISIMFSEGLDRYKKDFATVALEREGEEGYPPMPDEVKEDIKEAIYEDSKRNVFKEDIA